MATNMAKNPIPTLPGKSFVEMFDLVYTHNRYKQDFSDRLMIAIFWEESIFNNIKQTRGTALGFGQVEPSEFPKLKSYGLNLPAYSKGKCEGTLSDEQAVKVAVASLHYLRHVAKFSFEYCLKGYAGVKWALDNPTLAKPTAAERQKIIDNWKKCAAALEPVKPFKKPTTGEEEVILDALDISRAFSDARAKFRTVLFNPSHYT